MEWCTTKVLNLPVLWLAVLCSYPYVNSQNTFNVIGIFEPSQCSNRMCEDLDSPSVFIKAVDYANWREDDRDLRLKAQTKRIDSDKGFMLSQYVCGHALSSQITATLGIKRNSLREYMHILSDLKRMPYLELSPSQEYSRDMVIHMHPDPAHIVDLTRLLIQNEDKEDWNWENVFIVYESTTALTTNLELLELHQRQEITINSYHIQGEEDYSKTLDYIKRIECKRIIIDCDLASIKGFLNKALEKQMLTSEYHYHFLSLDLHVLDLEHYSYGGAKITWAQIVNMTSMTVMSDSLRQYMSFHRFTGAADQVPLHYFTTHNALIVDSMLVLAKALEAARKEPDFTTMPITCAEDEVNSKWTNGNFLRQKIVEVIEHNGMTGSIHFGTNGQRRNYTLQVMKLQPGGSRSTIFDYTPPPPDADKSSTKLEPYEPNPTPRPKDHSTTSHRQYIVTTIEEDPFLMKKKNHELGQLDGNDQYEGYIVDLMGKIAKEAANMQLDLNYKFVVVKDNEYGEMKIVNGTKTWTGMVGEIYNGNADMVAAPLTINYEREEVMDFTKPFMTFGISILYKLPEKEPPHLLSFMEPINLTVWGTIIVSVVVVSFSMYIFSRFSPTEWENPFPCQDNYEYLENQFNLSNAFWFSVGSIMQQGCDIMPKAPSTRIIAIAWWLFTLIIISSYTANLAAFLTITTLSDTFKSAEELAEEGKVLYGCKSPGNTCDFFAKSKIPLYKQMWEKMNTTPNAFSDTTVEGIGRVKEGGYAFLMESSYIQYQTNTDPKCELTQVGPPLNSLSYGIGLKPGHEYRDRLSSIILRLSERQELLELYNKWWKVNDNKCQQKDSSENNQQLELSNLGGIFVFLMGGLVIAGIVLCIEILVYAVKRSKQERATACQLLGLWLKNSVKGTFPKSGSSNSLDRHSISLHGKTTPNTIKPQIKHTIIEEEEPLNGHTDRVPCSTTTDTLLTH